MSEGPKKPHLVEALERAGLTQAELRRECRISASDLSSAFHQRVGPEVAGKISRYLGEKLGLSGKERKAVFTEIVNTPGRGAPLTDRVSSEDAFENLWRRDR